MIVFKGGIMGKNGQPPAKKSKLRVRDRLFNNAIDILAKGSQAGLEGIAKNNPASYIIPLFYSILYPEREGEEEANTATLIGVPEPIKNFTARVKELGTINQLLNNKPKTSEECSSIVALTNDVKNMKLNSTTSASISGLGGIGKTQLALMYAKLYARDYNYVTWLNAEQLSASFKTLVGNPEINIKIKDVNGLDKTDSNIAQELYRFLQKQKKKNLLIFDNVEDYETIREFLPHQSLDNDLHILITSRYQNWDKVAEKIELKMFSEEEAENFIKKELNIVTVKDVDELLKLVNEPEGEWSLVLTEKDIQNFIKNIEEYTKDENIKEHIQSMKDFLQEYKEASYTLNKQSPLVQQIEGLLKCSKADPSIVYDKDIKELNEKLQGLPLALQQAVTYIKHQQNVKPNFGIKDYLEKYNKSYKEAEKLLSCNLHNDPYMKTVMTTWKITLDKIEKEEAGKEAIRTLNVMAYLVPDNVPTNIFSELVGDQKLIDAINLLRSYSMINQGSKADLSNIHRLVQEVIRIDLKSKWKEEEALNDAFNVLNKTYNTRTDQQYDINNKDYKTMSAVLVCMHASNHDSLHERIVQLFESLINKEKERTRVSKEENDVIKNGKLFLKYAAQENNGEC